MAVPRLPVITSCSVHPDTGSDGEEEPIRELKTATLSSKPASKTVSFSNVRLGSLVHQPQPGDPYYTPRSSSRPRPLGLIPGKNDRLIALKKLNQLLSPWKPAQKTFSIATITRMDLPGANKLEAEGGDLKGAPPTNAAEPLVVINRNRSGWKPIESGRDYQMEARRKRHFLLAREAELMQHTNTEREGVARVIDDGDPDYMEVADKTIMKYCDSPPYQHPTPSNILSSHTKTQGHYSNRPHPLENKGPDKLRVLSKR